MITSPRKKNNNFLYNAVNLFEGGQRALEHNNFGAHIWTPELEELYGAKRGVPFEANPNLFTAYYDDPKTGEEASKYIIDKIWDSTNGDALQFASQYTGQPIDSPTVQNYASEIERRKNKTNLEKAKVRFKNVQEIDRNKSQLLEEFPDGEPSIKKAMKDGRVTIDDLKKELKKERIGIKAKFGKSVSVDDKDAFADNFEAGWKQLGSSIAKMADYVLTSDDFIDRLPALEQTKEMLKETDGILGDTVSPMLRKFAGKMDDEIALMDSQYIKDLGKEFEWSDLASPRFYQTKFARTLPNTLGLMLPSMGVAKAVGGIKGIVAGVMTSRPLESGMEALGLYEQLIEQGVDPNIAGEEASKLYQKNMVLAGSDGIQLALALTGLPPSLRNIFGKHISRIGGAGLGLFTEGYEEVVQNFFIEQGQASALGNPDPELLESLALASSHDKEAFALGALMGLGFNVAGQALSKEQVDNIIEEEQQRALNLEQARQEAEVAPANPEQTFYKDRVDNLTKHGDGIEIGFVDNEIEEVFTGEELIGLGYTNLEEFQQAKIKEEEEGYVNDGADRYRITIHATNYEDSDSDAQRLLLSRSATTADFLEDTAEAIYRRLSKTNPELKGNIDGWIARVEDVASQLGVQLPYTGAELFSKSFVYNSLGYADRQALPDFTVMPDFLQDAIVQEFETSEGGNLLDNMAMFGYQAEPTQAIENFEPTQVETSDEMFSLGSPSRGGIFVMGGDAVARDAKGRRSTEGIRYPEKHNGWQLSEGGATALENQAKAGNDVVVVYQYPSQTATESNPRFKETFEREKKKNARRKKGNKKTLIELRKDVERMVSEPDINLSRGKVLYVAQFDKILRGENRTVKHDVYPAQVVFKNVKELPRPFNIKTLTDSVDPSISRNAETFVTSRDLRSRSSNLYLAPNESPMVQELRNFIEGKQSTFDPRMDSDKVMATYRKEGETTVEGVFGAVNSERELAYFSALSDIAKDINLNGRHAQAGAITDKYGKENSMVFTVENPDQNALDLYKAYAGLLGNQYSVMHFKPDPKGKDLIYETPFKITDKKGLIDISNNLNEIGVDHTIEIRGSKGNLIIIDLNNELALDLKDKGVIDETTTATRGSVTFEGIEENDSLSSKQNRKIAREHWRSEIERLKELGYVSETGEQTYSDKQSKLSRGEGFSLEPKEDPSQYFNKKVSRSAKRRIKRAEKEFKPNQWRDLYRTFSSQVRRISTKLMNPIVKFQKRELDIKRKYIKEVTPFVRTISNMFKRGKRNKDIQRDYVNLAQALFNGDKNTIIDILTNNKFLSKRDALSKYKQFVRAHEALHRRAFQAGLKLNYIDTHFPRVITDYPAFLDYAYGITPKDKASTLQKRLDQAMHDKGEALTQEEKVNIANQYVKETKGVSNIGNGYNLKNRKIDKLTQDLLPYYAEPHEAIAMYINSMAGIIAQSEFMGNARDIYAIRKHKSGGYGIFDKRVKEFLKDEQHNDIVRDSKDNPELLKEMENRVKLDEFNFDLGDVPIQDQVGMMLIKIEQEVGSIPKGMEERLKQLLLHYFGMRTSSGFVNGLKNIGYATAMGSPSSAVTQLADLGGALYRGIEGNYTNPIAYARFIKNFVKALANNSSVQLEQLGVDDSLLQELTGTSPMLDKLFRATQLKRMDRVGKETYINSVIDRYYKDAKRFLKNKKTRKDAKFLARMEDKFSGDELTQVIKDLADKKQTELVELLAYSELLDIQPVARSEVPVGYLKYANGRIMYMLKTFMLKRIDFFGKEVNIARKQADVLEQQGKPLQAEMVRKTAYVNAFALAMILTMAEMGADSLKDLMFGRKIKISDLVLNNILKLALVSRYTFYNVMYNPRDAVVRFIVPPMDWLWDTVFIDGGYFLKTLGEEKGDIQKTVDKVKDRGIRTTKNIPLIGKYLYWRKTNWITGEESQGYGAKRAEKRERKGKRSGSGIYKRR